ncbi:DbpA RNA binding domain-containing protein [Oscillatoria amoena NRMC-F 0135]|nr:DbpA RNA binding domain-containing protein [Oscillatoria amoena NRMC-F 0135]
MHDVEVNAAEIEPFLPVIYKRLADLDKEELIKRFASLEFNRFLEYYRNSPDLNIDADSGSYKAGGSFARFFISIGEKDGVDKTGLLKFLNKQGLGNYKIGRINIKFTYSFFEIDESGISEVQERLNGVIFGNREIRVELETGNSGGGGDRGDRGDRGGRERSSSGPRSYGSREGGSPRGGGNSRNYGGGGGGRERGNDRDRGGDRGTRKPSSKGKGPRSYDF